jgi:hypothetical protein
MRQNGGKLPTIATADESAISKEVIPQSRVAGIVRLTTAATRLEVMIWIAGDGNRDQEGRCLRARLGAP